MSAGPVSDVPESEDRRPSAIVASRGTLRPLVRLAAPVVTEQLLAMMVMLVDVFLVGRYLGGDDALAAIGLMAYTMWLLTSVFEFISIGTTAIVARCIGAGERDEAARIANQSLLIGVVVAAVVWLGGGWIADDFVALLQLEGTAAALAVRYLDYIWPVMPMMMIERVGIACLRASGNMVIVFLVMSIVNVVNVVVSAVYATGWAGFPALGWDGVAIGTAAAHVVGGLLLLALLGRGYDGLKITREIFRPDLPRIRRILRIGVPGGVDVLSVIGCHLIFLSLINGLGTAAAAAHNVAVRLESMAFLPGAGIAVAATTLTGQFLGAGDRRRASRALLVACLVGSAVLAGVGFVFWFGGYQLASTFVSAGEQEVARQAAALLKIAAYAMVPLALQMILTGGLRGAGDTRWPLLFSLIGLLGLRIPLAYVLSAPGLGNLGVEGAWWAMLIDLSVRCGLIVWRFRHGGWQRVRV
ncbi:MAG: MATE family efflux transporter [Planctomycetota bacterium]|nr:MAG: MATE family efflux transporter [Planctomycetota bacterium]